MSADDGSYDDDEDAYQGQAATNGDAVNSPGSPDVDLNLASLFGSNSEMLSFLTSNGLADAAQLTRFLTRTESATSSKLARPRRAGGSSSSSAARRQDSFAAATTAASDHDYDAGAPASPAPSTATFYSIADPAELGFAGMVAPLGGSGSLLDDADADAQSLFGENSEQDLLADVLGNSVLTTGHLPQLTVANADFFVATAQAQEAGVPELLAAAPGSPYQQLLDVELDFSDPSDLFDDAASYLSGYSGSGALYEPLAAGNVDNVLQELANTSANSPTVLQYLSDALGLGNFLNSLGGGLGAAPGTPAAASPQDLLGSPSDSSYAGSSDWDGYDDGEGYSTDDASSVYTAGSASGTGQKRKRASNGGPSSSGSRKRRSDGPHTCPICSKGFNRAFNLKMHIETHNENREKNFPCPYCDMKFWREHDLVRHQPVHTGEKAFTCSCGKKYSRIDALQRHQKKQGHL